MVMMIVALLISIYNKLLYGYDDSSFIDQYSLNCMVMMIVALLISIYNKVLLLYGYDFIDQYSLILY